MHMSLTCVNKHPVVSSLAVTYIVPVHSVLVTIQVNKLVELQTIINICTSLASIIQLNCVCIISTKCNQIQIPAPPVLCFNYPERS